MIVAKEVAKLNNPRLPAWGLTEGLRRTPVRALARILRQASAWPLSRKEASQLTPGFSLALDRGMDFASSRLPAWVLTEG